MQEFKKVVKEKLAEKGISINRLAIELGVREVLLREVMSGRKTSRPLVLKMANYLSEPELLYIYEKELQKRKSNKSKKEV
jgi:ribosome-binding protein aMBF1 (putative translation factor)